MLPFPHSSSARRISRRWIKRVEKVAVYCSCRLPWDGLDTSLGSQYRKCKQWFHELCENIPKEVFLDNVCMVLLFLCCLHIAINLVLYLYVVNIKF